MTTKLPAIPDFDGSNLKEVVTALKEATEVRTGQRGDSMDAGVTFRDLEKLQLVQSNTDTTGATTGTVQNLTGNAPIRVPNITRTPVYDPGSDLTPPPVPTDLRATSVFNSVLLTWSSTGAANQGYWEIYRAFVDDVSQAQRVGTASSQGFTDVLPDGTARTLYYWIRAVSAAGVRSGWNSARGTTVTTSINPAVLVRLLEGEILESTLSRALAEKLNDAYDGAQSAAGKINAEAKTRAQEILAEAVARGAAITNEATIRQTADTSLAQSITTLTASVNSNAAAIQTESTTRASADSALSQQITTLASQVQNAGYATTSYVQTNFYTKTDIDDAVAGSSTTLGSSFTNRLNNYTTNAYLTTNYYTKSQADSAIATSTSTLAARLNNLNGQGITLEQNASVTASTLTGLSGQYTVKIDNNGHVSGFGLSSTATNGSPSSAFIVRADKFAIVDPDSAANSLTNYPSTDAVPFAVSGGATYIKQAFIKDADITDAKIASVSARKLTAGYVSATIGINGASIWGGNFYAGGSVSVSYDGAGYPIGFTANNPTVKIENGNVDIVAQNFRIKTQASSSSTTTVFEVKPDGSVGITSAAIGTGTIGTANIADTIQSTNYSYASGWQINKSGTATFNNATIRGTLVSDDNNFIIDLKNKYISISV